MPAFGTGVDASLGRIDYTPYLQGSMQGSSALGQGIASLGQEAAVAVKQYYDKKETNNLLEATTKSVQEALKTDPYLAQSVGIKDPTDTKAIGVAIQAFGGGDKKAGVAAVTKMLAQHGEQKVEDNAVKSAMQPFIAPGQQVKAYLSAGGKDALGFQKKLADLESAQASSAANRAQAGLYNAQAGIAGVPKPDNPSAFDIQYNNDIAAAQEVKGKIPLTAQEKAAISKGVAERVSPSNPNAAYQSFIYNQAGKRSEEYSAASKTASDVLPYVASAADILSSGSANTGFGEGAKLAVRNMFRSFGFPVDEDALAKGQVLQAGFGRHLLNIIQKTKGSTSDKETALFSAMAPSFDKSPQANIDLINIIGIESKRAIEIKKVFDSTLSSTHDAEKAMKAAEDVNSKYDSEYMSKIDELSKKYNVGTKPNAGSATGTPYSYSGSYSGTKGVSKGEADSTLSRLNALITKNALFPKKTN